MRRGKIKLAMAEPPLAGYEVDAYLMSEQWAIHKDVNSSQYVLTHIPSGKRVWSARTQTTLKMLIQEPEFMEILDDTNLEQVNRLSNCIKRFCDKRTDLESKPKKKIGWD